MQRVTLPNAALYPVQTIAFRLPRLRSPPLAHGSGFLAAFLAGIVVGDTRAPYKREIEHFASALSSIGEIVAFVVLGLTVSLSDVAVEWQGLDRTGHGRSARLRGAPVGRRCCC